MQAGRLRTIVEFQQATETADGYGGRTIAWATVYTVQCEVITQSGRESLKAGRIEASTLATLRARAHAVTGVDEAWRAVIGGVNWNIRSVAVLGQKNDIADMIIERASAGVAV